MYVYLFMFIYFIITIIMLFTKNSSKALVFKKGNFCVHIHYQFKLLPTLIGHCKSVSFYKKTQGLFTGWTNTTKSD